MRSDRSVDVPEMIRMFKKSGPIGKLIVLVIAAVILWRVGSSIYFLSGGLTRKYKPYADLAQDSAELMMNHDYAKLGVYAYDYMDIMKKVTDGKATESQIISIFEESRKSLEDKYRKEYGDNYGFQATIVEGKDIKPKDFELKIVQRRDEFLNALDRSIDIRDYLDVNSIDKMKYLKVSIQVKNQPKAVHYSMKLHIVKLKGQSEWKVLSIEQ